MEHGRFEIFSEFQLNNFLTDIQITLINGTIKAHKLVLAASSEFFKALLNSESCKEVSTGIINLPSVDYDVFTYIFDYIYMRTPSPELTHHLSFYIEVVEAADYLRMVDIIHIIDSKISSLYSFIDLSKEFDRIFLFPLKKTKAKLQTEFIDRIDNANLTDLSLISASTVMKIIESEYFTVNENLLWEFISSYIDFCSHNFEIDIQQQLIDKIRPALLDSLHFDSFHRFLIEHRLTWHNKTHSELRSIINDLPLEYLQKIDFPQQSPSDLFSKPRSVPYIIVGGIGPQNSPILSKLCLSNLRIDYQLSIGIDCDNFRCHSFGSHLVIVTKDWHLNNNLGLVLNLANHQHRTIPRWRHQIIDGIDNFHKFFGFSLALLESNLYLFGGCYFTHDQRTVPSNKLARFDFEKNQWEIVANIQLKVACWSSCAVTDPRKSGAFFISGGRSPRKYLRSFYAIDIDSCSVIDYPNLPFSMHGHSMDVSRDFVVVHGGVWDGCVRYEVLLFDLERSVWRVVALATFLGGVHIDYCCDTAMGESMGNGVIAVYELRNCDRNACEVYVHRIDVGGDREGVSTNCRPGAELVMSLMCAQPRSIMWALSLNLGGMEMTIGRDVFNCVPE